MLLWWWWHDTTVAQLHLALLQMCDEEYEEEVKDKEQLSEKEILERQKAIQDKIRAVSRFVGLCQTLRNEAETVRRIKPLAGDTSLNQGTLLGGRLARQMGLWQPQSKHKTRVRAAGDGVLVVNSLVRFRGGEEGRRAKPEETADAASRSCCCCYFCCCWLWCAKRARRTRQHRATTLTSATTRKKKACEP